MAFITALMAKTKAKIKVRIQFTEIKEGISQTASIACSFACCSVNGFFMARDMKAIKVKALHNKEPMYASKIIYMRGKRREMPQTTKKIGKTMSMVFKFPNLHAMTANTNDKAMEEITPALKCPLIARATKGTREK
jgi:hypothetical protein